MVQYTAVCRRWIRDSYLDSVVMCRAEDFVVTEIDSNGRLVQLDQLAPPPPPPPPPLTSDQAAAVDGGRVAKSRPDISEVPPLNELITQEQYHSLSELVDKMKVTLDPQLKDSVSLGNLIATPTFSKHFNLSALY